MSEKITFLLFYSSCLLIALVYLKSWIRSVLLVLTLRGPKPLPLIGNVLLINDSEKLQEIGNSCYKKYGRIFRIWISVIPAVFVVDPKDVQAILGSSKQKDKNFIYSLMHNFIGEGLISNNGSKWKLHRKYIQPCFHISILQLYVQRFSKHAKVHADKLRNIQTVNITSVVNNCVLDILHETVLGLDSDDSALLSQSPFRKGRITLPFRIEKPWYLLNFFYNLTSLAKHEVQQKVKLYEFTKKILTRRREMFRNGNISRMCLLDYFMEISEVKQDFTEDDVINETNTFMLAGQDSVAAAAVFALYYLAKHQCVQQNVLNELNDIFGGLDRDVEVNDLWKMKYLEQCIYETLRLCPSVPIIARKLSSDVRIGPYIIPSGCNVFLSPFVTQRLHHVFPNPQEFDPRRFSPENIEKMHPYAFIPFSAGQRNCIGYKFALLELKTVISTLLRKYRISLNSDCEVSLSYRITLRAKGGIYLQLHPR